MSVRVLVVQVRYRPLPATTLPGSDVRTGSGLIFVGHDLLYRPARTNRLPIVRSPAQFVRSPAQFVEQPVQSDHLWSPITGGVRSPVESDRKLSDLGWSANDPPESCRALRLVECDLLHARRRFAPSQQGGDAPTPVGLVRTTAGRPSRLPSCGFGSPGPEDVLGRRRTGSEDVQGPKTYQAQRLYGARRFSHQTPYPSRQENPHRARK
jgi:hypothetical protein